MRSRRIMIYRCGYLFRYLGLCKILVTCKIPVHHDSFQFKAENQFGCIPTVRVHRESVFQAKTTFCSRRRDHQNHFLNFIFVEERFFDASPIILQNTGKPWQWYHTIIPFSVLERASSFDPAGHMMMPLGQQWRTYHFSTPSIS